jgi:voltage-gated potassium channel
MRLSRRPDDRAPLSPRAEHAAKRFEIPVLIAALAVVPVVILEESAGASPLWLGAAGAANWVIWAVFAIELLIVTTLNRDHWAAFRRYWLNAVIVVISLPVLPVALAMTRLSRVTHLARVLRLLRFVRLAAVLSRGGQVASLVFRGHGLGYVMSVTALLAAGFGTMFAVVEPDVDSIVEGLWLAVVTVTSVGYGDIVPTTGVGRIAGTTLMLLGVGFVAALTAAVAARFVANDEARMREETEDIEHIVRQLQTQLDRIEARLGGVSSAGDDDATRVLDRTPDP